MMAGQEKKGTPAGMLQGIIDDLWEQLGEGIADDFTLEDFRGIAADLLAIEA